MSESSPDCCRWAWPQNSGDTHGIVDDNWLTIMWNKVCSLLLADVLHDLFWSFLRLD